MLKNNILLTTFQYARTSLAELSRAPRGRAPQFEKRCPKLKCVLMGNGAFRATGNVSKERKGPPKTVGAPEKVKRVPVSIQTGIGQ
ncbi:hypothetical protein TNCV_216751 [Trichonephila clavipes]|nr:hypothetical protein TNCV_216751 [Trichonephila clavipes]